MTKIMVVENEGIIALSIRRKLETLGYEVPIMVTTGEEALERAIETQPDLALMDIMLGEGIDGIETAARLKEMLDIAIIYLTANVDDKTVERAKVTEPFGYLIKPFEERELGTTIEMALYKHQVEQELDRYRNHLETLVAERTAELSQANEQLRQEIENRKETERRLLESNWQLARAYDQTLAGWAKALELRDTETAGHSHRVTELMLQLGRTINLSEEELVHIGRGSLIHDIGKMGIPDGILLKPGPLTPEERRIMERHPVYAYEMLKTIDYLKPALDIPYCHHERWDGSGYPRGLQGDEIPLAARMFALVDVWDAIQSDRPYNKAWERDQAVAFIQERSGSFFDPDLAAVFINMVTTEECQ